MKGLQIFQWTKVFIKQLDEAIKWKMKFDISKYEAVSFTCALEMDKTRSASASHHAIDQYIFKTIRGQEVERINFILSIKGIF